MAPKYDIETIRAMNDMGLVASFEFGGGFCSPEQIKLSPEDVLAVLEHGQDHVLRLIGVEPAAFEEWQATDGRALCMERLKNGKLCGNQVASQCSLGTWQRLHRNAYCHRHGGE